MAPNGPAVVVERRQHTMVVTFNRPEVMNAVNAELALGVGEALEEADADPEIRAVIVTGAGRAFSAGADLKALAQRGPAGVQPAGKEHWGFAGLVTHPINKPVIAAVNGYALGGGTEIALACDLVVAAESAAFGLPEVKRGIIAGAGGLVRLPAQLPRKVALQMILTGEPIDAATALHWGLVNDVVADDKVLSTALNLAERIGVNAPLAVQASKRVAVGLVNGVVSSEQAAWALNHREAAAVAQSEDATEGTLAFVAKRAPQWKAR